MVIDHQHLVESVESKTLQNENLHAHCTQCKKCGKHFKMKSHMHTAQCTRCKKCGKHSKMKSHSAHNRLPPTRQWWLMLPISIASLPCHATAPSSWLWKSVSIHLLFYPILEETINEQGYKQTRIKRHLAWEKVVVQWAPGWKNWEKRALSRRSAPIKTITRAL